MRPPRTITCLALALILTQTTGCVSFRPASPDLWTTQTPGLKVGTRYRFTLRDGREEVLYFQRANSLVIVGQPKKNLFEVRSVDRAEIWKIDEQFSTVPWDKIAVGVLLTAVSTWVMWEAGKSEVHDGFCDLFPTGKGC